MESGHLNDYLQLLLIDLKLLPILFHDDLTLAPDRSSLLLCCHQNLIRILTDHISWF